MPSSSSDIESGLLCPQNCYLMEPLTLLALASAAGFVFNKMAGSPAKNERREFTYSKDLVARHAPDNSSDFDLDTIDVLPEYQLVKSLVEHEFPIIFITGGAGTGKSTFVRWALKEFHGSVLLGAPTGMAAVNVGGKTLHSLCSLPPSWIVKKDIKTFPQRKELLEAKVLIIDEMSMVTANLLDGVSAFLRVNRRVNKPFGGLPVIMVGDMFQLPPVVNRSARSLFTRVYGSAKFYNAKCLSKATYYAVELNKTYRQSDQTFVDILTKIREGVELKETLFRLNSGAQITPTPPEGAVWLSPRNREVEYRNEENINLLPGNAKEYLARVKGTFKPDRYPSPAKLVLKIGTQVMFTRTDKNRRWTSGSIGIIRRLLDDKVFVELLETERLVDVGRVQWTDYQYSWDKKNARIARIAIGTYHQLPVLPAWSMTIHKAQGKTIERVHLDLGEGAFETGQTYVALSRCRSLKGLSMARPLTRSDVLIDHESKRFYDNLRAIISKLPPEQMYQKLNPK